MYENIMRKLMRPGIGWTLLAAVLIWLAFCGIRPGTVMAFSGNGTGIDTDPFLITSKDQLNEIKNSLSSVYRLEKDIDLTGVSWTPIGNGSNKFTGKLLGNNHVISNLTINSPSTGYVGMFGYTAGLVENLGLKDVNIVAGDNRPRVGGLAGHNAGNISKCYITGSVTVEYRSTWGEGGLVGKNDTDATISNCYSAVSVTNTNGSTLSIYRNYVGGLVGINNNGKIIRCYASGTVNSNTQTKGGLVGKQESNGEINNSYSINSPLVGTGTGTISGSAVKNTTEMKQQNTFVGWDFTSIWRIYEAKCYPYLIGITPASAAPTIPVVNDDNNTFGWTYTADSSSANDYEYSVNSGTTWMTCSSNPQNVGNNAYAVGVVQVRFAGKDNKPPGVALASNQAYTHRPSLSNVTVGGIAPTVTGEAAAPTLTFRVNPATMYTMGTANLSDNVDYRIQNSTYNITGTATTSENLMQTALTLFRAYQGINDDVRGSTLISNSPLTITLTIAGSGWTTVYTVNFVVQ